MIGAALAAQQGLKIMTLDHTVAYLNAKMKGPVVHMVLTKEVTDMLVSMDRVHLQYVRPDGKIIVKLMKALYGCVQSASLWYNELRSTLMKLNFTANPYDVCSFTRIRGQFTDRILVYVDDLFVTSDTEDVLDEVDKALKDAYGGVTSKKGTIHEYLGIKWDFSTSGEVTLTMDGYVNDILTKYDVKNTHKTPADDQLFTTTDDGPALSRVKQEDFHSLVMTLHYMAKRVRTDILTAVSWCASRVLSPTEEDERKLDRIMGYLKHTKNKNMVLRIGTETVLKAYVDASFAVYQDAKSVTGAVIMLGDAVIFVKSAKQKIVTRSSTESELVAISDSLSQILWTREYPLAASVPVGPAILYQDNMSTIFLANKGRSTSERTRHIQIRYYLIHHYIDENDIVVVHMPTANMIADIMTKPLHGALYERLSAILSGRRSIDV